MSKRDWKLFVEDILECIGKIEKYIQGMKFEDFENDDKTTDAHFITLAHLSGS